MVMEKKFNGKYLGKLGEIIGQNSSIKIDEFDCWLNFSRNIELIINDGESKLICSQNLSELIRNNNLDKNTETLKKHSVYEFIDGSKYVTHLVENKIVLENPEFDARKAELDYKVKVLTKNNELYLAESHRRDKTVYLTISELKVLEIIEDILLQVSQSNIDIEFTKEELVEAFKKLPLHSHNTSTYLKNDFRLSKQVLIFNNWKEARFSIFGNGRPAIVKAICDVRYFK
jgi:hypothetical protein